jgi:hypothetical protein
MHRIAESVFRRIHLICATTDKRLRGSVSGGIRDLEMAVSFRGRRRWERGLRGLWAAEGGVVSFKLDLGVNGGNPGPD